MELILRSEAGGLEGCRARLAEWTTLSQRFEGPIVFLSSNPEGTRRLSEGEAQGHVVLVRRSAGTPFAEKAQNIAAGGAIGVLVANDREGDLCRMGLFGAPNPGIPAALLSRTEGEGLIERVRSGEEVRIHYILQTMAWRSEEFTDAVEDLASTTASSGGASARGPPPASGSSGQITSSAPGGATFGAITRLELFAATPPDGIPHPQLQVMGPTPRQLVLGHTPVTPPHPAVAPHSMPQQQQHQLRVPQAQARHTDPQTHAIEGAYPRAQQRHSLSVRHGSFAAGPSSVPWPQVVPDTSRGVRGGIHRH